MSGFLVADKRCSLFIVKDARGACLREMTKEALHNPEQAQNRERKRAPMDESTRTLVRENGEERPGNGNRACKISLRCGEGVRGGGRLEEEKTEKHEDLRPDACSVGERIDAECLEQRQNNKDRGPAL